MAYINVAEWTPDQVTDWLKGLDNSMYHYIVSFTNNPVHGHRLLMIRPHDLKNLGMFNIGHQEIVLECVEYLRNFHYNLDKENLQYLALNLSTSARCLVKTLSYYDGKNQIETQILSDITNTIATLKPLIGWLGRTPFKGVVQFNEIRTKLLRIGIEMATSANRDRFARNPVVQIGVNAETLSKLADYIIKDITDPMILQPASLNLVTIKKRESELGFNIAPSYNGLHVVTDIKYNSPAHTSGKIEVGDEIVQINYQTVVGWQYKKVIQQLQESSPDVLLTLKKRPKHTKIYGQIYMKPYRLPSKKKTLPYYWQDSLPSPRTEIIREPGYTIGLCRATETDYTALNDDSAISTSDKGDDTKEFCLYMPKPRAVLQRRHTICSDYLTDFKGSVVLWHQRKHKDTGDESPSLRDKSVSFGFGLELTPRPTTCLGLAIGTPNKNGKLSEISGSLKNSLPDIKSNATDLAAEPRTEISKVVRFDSVMKCNEYDSDNKYTCNIESTVLEVFEPIPYVDDDELLLTPIDFKTDQIDVINKSNQQPDDKTLGYKVTKMTTENGIAEAVNIVLINRTVKPKRGKLDKSHSTPAYYDSDGDSDVPPAIEPRKEHLLKTPPAPPPRPRKSNDLANYPSATGQLKQHQQTFVKPPTLTDTIDEQNKSKIANVIDLKNKDFCQTDIGHSIVPVTPTQRHPMMVRASISPKKIPATKHFLEERFEELELVTPNKTKNLTLKKKNSILAKRRQVSLKSLETSDIQGHLYRRSKDKNGVTYWAKLYFVLIDTSLYGFKVKDSDKADCMIFLSGFTVSIASEVHSKPFAFKVYHPAKTFYFAAESQQALNQWMEFITQAIAKGNTALTSSNQNIKELYSETDSSGDEFDNRFGSNKHLATPSPIANNSLPKSNGKKNQTTDNSGSGDKTKSEKYHINFGSLKKFTKQSLQFSRDKGDKDKDKKTPSDVPIPTAQFRSYRKVPGNAGMQLGTNSMISTNSEFCSPFLTNTHPEQNPSTPMIVPAKIENQRKLSISSLHQPLTTVQSISTVGNQQPLQSSPPSVPATPTRKESHSFAESDFRDLKPKPIKSRMTLPYNYIHASNPNLVEFDFQTSKTLDCSFPKIKLGNSWDAHNNLQGFVTLKDLMLREQAEKSQQAYNNRVNLGVEKKVEAKTAHQTESSAPKPANKIQSRSLPKTPDYEQSFKPNDSDIIMTRSKEGQKLRDFGYELITDNDPSPSSASSMSSIRRLGSNMTLASTYGTGTNSSGRKKSALNWIGSSDKKSTSDHDDKSLRSVGSFKRGSNKLMVETLESFKTSTEKIFQFKNTNNDKESLQHNSKLTDKSTSLKNVTSYTPLTLPLNKKFHGLSAHVDGGKSSNSQLVNLKKSSTYNSPDFVIIGNGHHHGHRKNSAPSYLTKLTFSGSKSNKEKRWLGSPRLHRALFGDGRRVSDSNQSVFDHEVFAPVEFPKKPMPPPTTPDTTSSNPLIATGNGTNYHINGKSSISQSNTTIGSAIGSPDYPNLEYPPVFEPETYSLSDPNTSLTLLRRRNQKPTSDRN